MSRPTLHLRNVTEDRVVEVISARLVKERGGEPKTPRVRPHPESIRWNGRLYVPVNDPRAEALFSLPQENAIGGGDGPDGLAVHRLQEGGR